MSQKKLDEIARAVFHARRSRSDHTVSLYDESRKAVAANDQITIRRAMDALFGGELPDEEVELVLSVFCQLSTKGDDTDESAHLAVRTRKDGMIRD